MASSSVTNASTIDPSVKISFPKRAFKTTRAFVINSNLASSINACSGLIRSAYSAIQPAFRQLKILSKAAAASQLTCILTLPFDSIETIKDGWHFIREKGKHQRFDNAISFLGNASQAGDSISTFFSAFADLGFLPSAAMLFLSPASLACSAVSSVFFVINGRAIYYNIRLMREFNKCAKESPDAVLTLLKDKKYFLERQCSLNTRIIKKKIQEVNSSKSPEDLEKVYTAIRRRIQFKIFTNTLGIAITAVGILASSILFTSSMILAPLAVAPIVTTAFVITGSSLLACVCASTLLKISVELGAGFRLGRMMRLATP